MKPGTRTTRGRGTTAFSRTSRGRDGTRRERRVRAALADEWARAGVTDAVVAPGSRSAPLALALARDDRLRTQVVLDERSAAFRALGLALASRRPVVVLCTSGTAAANFAPAVIEASHARVPLIVCTADRPPELRDTGAGQTIDQLHLYGDAVRWFCDPGPPIDEPGVSVVWRSLACRAFAESFGPPAGPVHLNLPFREPLVPTGSPPVDAPGRPDGRPWTVSTPATRAPVPADVARLAELVRARPRGLLVAGWGAQVAPATAARFAEAAGWPVLADPVSQLRTPPNAVSTYEALLRAPGFAEANRPDLVVRVGAPLTSKIATAWLEPSIEQVLVDPDGAWLDPARAAAERLAVDAEALLAAVADALGPSAPSSWLADWQHAESRARDAIDRVLDAPGEAFEGRVARDVTAALPDGATLVVASEPPVRGAGGDASCAGVQNAVGKRAANGIDGFVSTRDRSQANARPRRRSGCAATCVSARHGTVYRRCAGPATFVLSTTTAAESSRTCRRPSSRVRAALRHAARARSRRGSAAPTAWRPSGSTTAEARRRDRVR